MNSKNSCKVFHLYLFNSFLKKKKKLKNRYKFTKWNFSLNPQCFRGQKVIFNNILSSSIKPDFFSLFCFIHPPTIQFFAYFSHSFFPICITVSYIIWHNQWRMSSAVKWEEESHLPMDRVSDTTVQVAAFTSFQLLCQKINPWLQQNLDTFFHLQRGLLIIHGLSSFSKLIYSEAKHPTKCSLLNLLQFFYRSSFEVKISHNRVAGIFNGQITGEDWR